eukprot:jgi/Hompol1/84/HPOL_002445-RA
MADLSDGTNTGQGTSGAPGSNNGVSGNDFNSGTGAGTAPGESLDALARMENEIPDELKEYPPPESIASLDKHMDALLEDMKILFDSRQKESQASGENRLRMPLLPQMLHFQNYKTLRKDNIESILKVEMPARKISSTEVIQKELATFWTIEEKFEGNGMLTMLISFFKERAECLLQENSLLISRWSRFCRTSFDISKFYNFFSIRSKYLRQEFADAVNRYERLHEFQQLQAEKKRAAEDAARIDAERRGLAVLKNKSAAGASTSNKKQDGTEDDRSGSNILDDSAFFGAPELPANPGYEIADLAIYLRWMSSMERDKRDIAIFMSRARMSVHQERQQMLADYRFITRLNPGEDITECPEYYYGLSSYIKEPPTKSAKAEDFITEFDLLVSHWQLETAIDQEDGRPFAYEVDHKFFDRFSEQTLEVSLAPYEPLNTSNDSSTSSDDKFNASNFSGNSGLDSLTASLAALSGYAQKSSLKNTKFPKLRRANWISSISLVPSFDSAHELYATKLTEVSRSPLNLIRNDQRPKTEAVCEIITIYFNAYCQLQDLDMELCIEHAMLLSTDVEQVSVQLKDMAKRVWERAASTHNSRPLSVKISIIPQQREYKPAVDTTENRIPRTLDFGMRTPGINENQFKSAILSSKKREYGQILKANEDNRKLEQELLNADPNHIIESSSIINPTIATVFAEHEVFAYLQLRFIKIREIRIKVLHQFNYLRSIEKRLNMDIVRIENQRLRGDIKDSEVLVSQMWQRSEFLDMGSSSDDTSAQSKTASELGNATKSNPNTHKSLEFSDYASVVNDTIQLTDAKGVAFVYDVAFQDLEQFDKEMLRILTIYINASRKDDHVMPEYLDELRFRVSNKRNDILNATFLNPESDRAQAMLEYYEAHLKFQYSKIELVNTYLEVYENVTEIEKIKAVALIITSIVHMKPIQDFKLNLTIDRSESKPYENRKNSQSTFDRHNPEKFFDSILKPGLPVSHHEEDGYMITMHHPETSFQMTEVIPGLDVMIELWDVMLTLSNTISGIIECYSIDRHCVRSVADCTVFKILNCIWESMLDSSFQLPARVRRLIGGLDSNVWLHNPYMPDALLNEYYVPYDQTSEGTYKSLGITLTAPTCFNDASFQKNGREILYRAIKVLVLRSRLLRVWIESENWRKACEEQLTQMGVNKANFIARLGPLKFESGGNGSADGGEDQMEDAEEESGEQTQEATESNEDISGLGIGRVFAFGPLAITELEETPSIFDLSTFQGVTSLMRVPGIAKLKMSIKIQLLDKNWFMAAVEMNDLVLEEIHSSVLNGIDLVSRAKKNTQVAETKKDAVDATNRFDIDYRTLIKLTEWYYANMVEVVVEDCERTEFAKLIFEMRKAAKNILFSPPQNLLLHARLIFLLSNIQRNSDYFASKLHACLEQDGDEKLRYKQSVQTQNIIATDSAQADKLARLWYLPHLTEIILAMGGPDKPHKGAVDLSHRIFKNQQIYSKSTKVHQLLLELYTIVTVYSHLLQDNRRYTPAVKKLREADYVVTTMNLIKRDLLNQGEPAEYLRVYNFLSSKWQFWYLKLKYSLSYAMHSLEMNMLSMDRVILAMHYAKCITTKFLYLRMPKRGKHEKPLRPIKAAFVISRTHVPSMYVFGMMSAQGKRLCDAKMVEIEETIEEHVQVVQFSGTDDDLNKSLTDCLTSNIKLLALRREYFRMITGGKMFDKYKMRILVPAIRQYYKSGAKGGASATNLLSDDIITTNTNSDVNRVARAAFERCQIIVLQNEIIRDFTAKLVHDGQLYFDKLSDERLGKMFRSVDSVLVASPTDHPEFAFNVSEEDYNSKMSIFNTFLADLHHSSVEFMQSLKDQQSAVATVKSGRHQQRVDDSGLYTIFDDKKIFACKKDFLGMAVVRLATHLNQWKIDRVSEQERFIGALYAHLLDTIRNCEHIILYQAQEKREMMINFKRESRLRGHEMSLDVFAEMATMSVELNELKKSRRVDERKMRNKIVEEYEDLMQELVREIGVLRHRFREYQIDNLNDVMNIMAEAKKEQLIIMTRNEELPLGMRETAERIIGHEEQLAALREQNHELKMTVLKIRSMFLMKEQALKCSFDRQLRKLSDSNKEGEEKLWDSYRDAEARERALRRQISAMQKSKSAIEFQNEILQRQLREEQAKPRSGLKGAAGAGVAAGAQNNERSPSRVSRIDKTKDQKSQKMAELEDRLRRYEGINIDNLIRELSNKTALVEELLQEKKDRWGEAE